MIQKTGLISTLSVKKDIKISLSTMKTRKYYKRKKNIFLKSMMKPILKTSKKKREE